jgi:IS5 family transposase
MRPKPPVTDAPDDLFRQRLTSIIDARHPLVKLAARIDWAALEARFAGRFVAERGRPALPVRLMVGLHLLGQIKNLSDEAVCAVWVENPYFQHFCGETFFQHTLPADRSSISLWRSRIQEADGEAMLAATVAMASVSGAVKAGQLERVTVDTTVATKAVAHPTDSHLMVRAIEHLNRVAEDAGVRVRQSYLRVTRHARREAARLMHGRGHKQAMAHLRFIRVRLGRLIRDITAKTTDKDRAPGTKLAGVLERASRIYAQAFGKKPEGGKLYAFHAPEVECIGKGKARVRYEFGVKASFAVTNARCPGGQFVLGAQSRPGLPHDGHTLKDQLAQVARITGKPVQRAYVDRGYRGHGIKDADGPDVYISHTRGIVSPTIKRELKRRNAIEPIIGHMTADGRLERHAYAGTHGDTYAVMMAAIGHNLRLLLAWLKALWRAWVTAMIAAMPTQRQLTAA